ncbi:thioredoxin family protein [Nocardia huaxiensis]|uniref:Thioredoxin family protein n=1 Tax=Nocardia huaxiensis TaxID=2755382 RepID=A0A7D6VEK7_9NOCA|nr:thioredoxin family protein [Nocardia huaxiensis]QLY33233.1 thioredoxin family protein [Nocardia huaxiensis]UFS99834.1 thioredoxin family protein [Nocardia huaxiensis]
MALESLMVQLGTPAPDFTLPSLTGEAVSLDNFQSEPALLVAFLSNHCPYVRRIEQALGALTAELHARGLATVAISSNDVRNYPDDDAEHLREQVLRAGFTFPYLIDESQDVARAYHAACTPDLFLYDADRKLAYRGEFDAARPRNEIPSDGASLRRAVELVLANQPVPEPHTPSIGCGLKWKPGTEPRSTIL